MKTLIKISMATLLLAANAMVSSPASAADYDVDDYPMVCGFVRTLVEVVFPQYKNEDPRPQLIFGNVLKCRPATVGSP